MQDALQLSGKAKQANTGDTNFVQILSLTVDPAHDSAPVLRRYADKYGVNSDLWWMLTGPKKTIYDFALNELKLGLQDSVSVDSNFVHTDYIALINSLSNAEPEARVNGSPLVAACKYRTIEYAGFPISPVSRR